MNSNPEVDKLLKEVNELQNEFDKLRGIFVTIDKESEPERYAELMGKMIENDQKANNILNEASKLLIGR